MTACNSSGQKNVDAKNNVVTVADSNVSTINNDTGVATSKVVNQVVTADKLIVPAKSIGLSAIGETGASIAKKLGRPEDGDAAMGKAISTWYSKNNKAHSTTIYFTTNFGDSTEASRVSQIRITSPYFSTADHLAVGSNFTDISRSFPSLKKNGFYPLKGTKKNVDVLDDVSGGIAFEINADTCVGITIHKPGDKAFQTYLNFLEGYQPVGP